MVQRSERLVAWGIAARYSCPHCWGMAGVGEGCLVSFVQGWVFLGFSRGFLQIEEFSAACLPQKSVRYLLLELHVGIGSYFGFCLGGLAILGSLLHFSVSCVYCRLSAF